VLARDHPADAPDLAVDHAVRPVPDAGRRLGDLGLLVMLHRGALAFGDMHRAAAEDGGSGRCRGEFC
jgi:hypothetical protein